MNWLVEIVLDLLASFLAVLAGLAFNRFVRDRNDRRDYDGWRVKVIRTERNDKTGVDEVVTKVDRPISIPKAKDIRTEPADLSVFLKGVVSPYAILTCDLIDERKEKPEEKVLQLIGRTYTINLDHNKATNDQRIRDMGGR
jgi:putative protein kinase ArgK-like GTPase of G3E family